MNATPLRRRLPSIITAFCAAILVACGGGGGGGGGGCGGGGYGGSGSCTPTVSISNVAGTVNGTVTLTASAAAKGTYTVSNVQFKVDGMAVGTADTLSPYSYDWDSTSVPDAAHQITAVVTDSAAQTATSAMVALTVGNNGTFAVTLAANQLFPVPVTSATGSGSFTVNKISGPASGSVTLAGVIPTIVELGDAYAGAQSLAVITLTQDAVNANLWNVPASSTLSAPQRADLAAGKFYVLVRSAAFPNGELRAQLLPAGIAIKFGALTGSDEVPPVVTSGTGQIAVTVDAAGLHAAVHVTVAGILANGAELATGAWGTVGVQKAVLTPDALDPNHHFLNETIALVSADVTNFTGGLWYGNVFSAAHVNGEIRGQVADPAPTLTQLQTDIFTPICSVCHTGGGAGLPGIQNLTAGNTYTNIVNVASIQQGTLVRVKPGDPDNSYLVRKIQGTPGITGVQMPATGGPLSQAQIDEVRAWVAAGAKND